MSPTRSALSHPGEAAESGDAHLLTWMQPSPKVRLSIWQQVLIGSTLFLTKFFSRIGIIQWYLTLSQTSQRAMRVCSTRLLKTLWEKEKLLVTSNFSFSHCFFTRLENFIPFSLNLKLSSANYFSLEESKNLSFGKWLIPLLKFNFYETCAFALYHQWLELRQFVKKVRR